LPNPSVMENKVQILSTGTLGKSLAEAFSQEGLGIDIIPFITTEPIQAIDVQQEIEMTFLQMATVVFTSSKAVEAVAFYLDEQEPEWQIYCIGTSTGKLVAKYFGEAKIAGTAGDAASLALLIAEPGTVDKLIFFCGNHRRDELPEVLRQEGIEVDEIVVYQTIPVPHKLERSYHGILFFSPSAVQSFFRDNRVNPGTKLFAIGNTTAQEISKHCGNPVIVSDEPAKPAVVAKVLDYFTGT
jgi:uroporphyrinogen-III synthase